jgi:hypothetical protein
MYLCRQYTDSSLAEIGRAMNRDHPSVRNAIRKVERAVLEKAPLRYQVEELARQLDEAPRRQEARKYRTAIRGNTADDPRA